MPFYFEGGWFSSKREIITECVYVLAVYFNFKGGLLVALERVRDLWKKSKRVSKGFVRLRKTSKILLKTEQKTIAYIRLQMKF